VVSRAKFASGCPEAFLRVALECAQPKAKVGPEPAAFLLP
jgi:hypothetical protein